MSHNLLSHRLLSHKLSFGKDVIPSELAVKSRDAFLSKAS